MEPVRQIVKRPNETIGIVPNGKQRITLLVRRLYSVILLFSQQQGEREEYSAALADMLSAAHSSGSNRAQVKEVLRDIRAIGVDWNVRDGEHEVWKNVGLIEEPGLIDGRGTPTIVTWKLPKLIRARLLDPRGFFTRISLEMMTRLRSGASIALYEICCQYVSNDHGKGEGGLTNRAPIAEWMPRLTGSRKAAYEYKFLKRDVLLTAIEEINEITDLKVELIEHKIGRRVGELQFRVFKKDVIDSTLGVAGHADALQRMRRTLARDSAPLAATSERTVSRQPQPAIKRAVPPAQATKKIPAEAAAPMLVKVKRDTSTGSLPYAEADPVPVAETATAPAPSPHLADAAPRSVVSNRSPDANATDAATDNELFLQRMLAIGTPLSAARRLMARFGQDPVYLDRHLDFVEQRLRSSTSAPLMNTVAFLQKALDHGYAEARPQTAGATPVARSRQSIRYAESTEEVLALPLPPIDAAAQAQHQATLLRRAEVWARFQSMPQDGMKALLVENFLARSGATLKTFYRKNGVNNMIVKASLTDWLIHEKNF